MSLQDQMNAMDAAVKKTVDEGFAKTMQSPAIRLLISQVPETGQEVLATLLKEFYQAGSRFGEMAVSVQFLKSMLKPPQYR